jgi:hypothetical protein
MSERNVGGLGVSMSDIVQDRKKPNSNRSHKRKGQYKFGFGDPGLFLELYLPTKFDVLLTTTLDEGFKLPFVKKYLVKYIDEIRELLVDHESLGQCSPSRIKEFSEVFRGYSLYHGSGAYSSDDKIEKETVTIARMIFLPPLSESDPERAEERFWARRFLSEADRKKTGEYDEKERRLVARLSKWLEDIGLFVNGYVVHRISQSIQDWREIGTVRQVEDEIWVGSLRCLAVNRVTFSR